jgi:hypothetical protein
MVSAGSGLYSGICPSSITDNRRALSLGASCWERIRNVVTVEKENENENEDGRKYNSGHHSFLLIDCRCPWECRHDEVNVEARMGHGTANHSSAIMSGNQQRYSSLFRYK